MQAGEWHLNWEEAALLKISRITKRSNAVTRNKHFIQILIDIESRTEYISGLSLETSGFYQTALKRPLKAMNTSRYIARIRSRATQLEKMTDQELKQLSLDLRYLAMTNTPVRRLIPEGFALVVEAARRHLDMVHYDVQLQCGIEMAFERIAEMKTGEGKTLTASLVSYLCAIRGKGMHVITFNEYLAERDCEILRPLYLALGLSCGVLKADQSPEQRREMYRCDITYGAAKEFGFDFLRDRMAIDQSKKADAGVMRGTYYALVDEADSIMIDEARTPLVIGMISKSEQETVTECCNWAAEHAGGFAERADFAYDEMRRSVELTAAGIRKCRNLPGNQSTRSVSIQQLYGYMKNAIKVNRDFHLDKNYAIIEGEIVIVDEFTGRPAEGRQWQQGIHQAVQAKEGQEVTPPNRQAAMITIQSYFNLYEQLCGMTGTAFTSRKEFKKVYKKTVKRIPTHRPIKRKQLPTKIFRTSQEKYDAIAEDVQHAVAAGRSVLIGNRSVVSSELLSASLEKIQVEHVVLNARFIEKEAEIVELAGQPSRVTVATNMAGRGTDIKLHDSVKQNGGLHVILTELHESERIDWQLIGRASRQGNPGSYQFCLSLEDEILRLGLGDEKAAKLQKTFANHRRLNVRQVFGYFLKAQAKLERRYLTDRLILQRQDKERQKNHFETGQDPYLSVVSS